MSEIRCPHCGRPIYDDDALLCLYCGKSLKRNIGFMGGMKNAWPRIVFGAFVLIVLLSFILFLVF